MSTQLLIATRNQAKFDSFADLLQPFQFKLLSLTDVGITDSVTETEATFQANAIFKARTYYSLTHLPTLGDDGGLEIEALNGWPGVYSRRIFGLDKPEATDQEMIAEALKRLRGVPWEKRTAKMRAVVALALPNNEVKTADVSIAGYITNEPSPTLIPGFPFRSIFYLAVVKKVVAELSREEQNDFMNHRKQAILKLGPYLKNLESRI